MQTANNSSLSTSSRGSSNQIRVLLAQFAVALAAFGGGFVEIVGHIVIRRADRAGLAVAGGGHQDLFQLNVVRGEDFLRAGDRVMWLIGPGDIGGDGFGLFGAAVG